MWRTVCSASSPPHPAKAARRGTLTGRAPHPLRPAQRGPRPPPASFRPPGPPGLAAAGPAARPGVPGPLRRAPGPSAAACVRASPQGRIANSARAPDPSAAVGPGCGSTLCPPRAPYPQPPPAQPLRPLSAAPASRAGCGCRRCSATTCHPIGPARAHRQATRPAIGGPRARGGDEGAGPSTAAGAALGTLPPLLCTPPSGGGGSGGLGGSVGMAGRRLRASSLKQVGQLGRRSPLTRNRGPLWQWPDARGGLRGPGSRDAREGALNGPVPGGSLPEGAVRAWSFIPGSPASPCSSRLLQQPTVCPVPRGRDPRQS